MGGHAEAMQNPSLIPDIHVHHSDSDEKSDALRDCFCILGRGEIYSAYSSNKVTFENGLALSLAAVSVSG